MYERVALYVVIGLIAVWATVNDILGRNRNPLYALWKAIR
jgi:hypothetical protein